MSRTLRSTWNQSLSGPLVAVGRVVLWGIALTASVKPAEIFGPGEQSALDPPTIDFVFRCLVLAGSLFAVGVAMFAKKIRGASLLFVPFLLWALLVAIRWQSDPRVAKQIGSYASWIFFYVAASALLDRAGDYRKLATVAVGSVFVSALGGQLQHWLGYGPALGSRWAGDAAMEFGRIHTGGGGILLDSFAPSCAAVLLIATAGSSLKRHIAAWLLILWGSGNILRGGMLALAAALCWFLWQTTAAVRRRMLPVMGVALVCGVLLFGGTVAAKIAGTDDTINTSGRLDTWPLLAGWMMEEPLTGHGPDADMELLAKSAGGRDLRASHNELLSTGVNYGMVGVLLLWAPLLLLLARGIQSTRGAEPNGRDQAAGATAVLLLIILLSFTDNTLRSPGVMILAVAPAAIVLSVRAAHHPARSEPPEVERSLAQLRDLRLLPIRREEPASLLRLDDTEKVSRMVALG